MRSATDTRLDKSEHLLVIVAACLITFPSWVWAGESLDSASIFVLLSTLLCVLTLVRVIRLPTRHDTAESFRRLFKDPVFYAGLVFLGLCFFQYKNAIWPQGLPEDAPFWMSQSPPYGWRAFSVDSQESFHGLAYLFGAFVLILAIRYGVTSRKTILLLFRLVLLNGFFLGLYGILQYYLSADSIYFTTSLQRHFFASFTYENHAAQYFYLLLALLFGLVLHMLVRMKTSFTRFQAAAVLAFLVVFFFAAVLSFSRTGLLFASIIILAAMVRFFRGSIISLSPVVKLTLGWGAVAACLLCFVFLISAPGDEVREDFKSGSTESNIIQQALDSRMWQWTAAVDIIKEYPVFGVGVRGFRYFIPYYGRSVPPRIYHYSYAGQVHSEPLRMLCEFGLVGTLALLVVFLVPAAAVSRGLRARRDLHLVGIVGTLALVLHGLWDLPFRSPAILYLFVCVYFCLARYQCIAEERMTRAKTETEPQMAGGKY